MQNTEKFYDVIVIGGGPAGTTTASLLVDNGWKVALFEKDSHPKFHIGESLLPMSMPLLKELGVYEQVQAIGNKKLGASFFLEQFDFYCSYIFENALNKNNPSAFQVKRSEFDSILFKNAIDKGVEAKQNSKVTAVLKRDDGLSEVRVNNGVEEIDYQCRFVIDASGRDTFLGKQNKSKQANPKHKSAAIFAHFEHAKQFSEAKNGNIGIYWFDHGWLWLIPFADGTVSVGAVSTPEYLKQRQGDLGEFLQEIINSNRYLSKHLAGAKMITEVQATGNYSYFCQKMYGDNYLLVGDAYAFVDPVFSSGVHIALRSAFEAAKTVDKVLTSPNCTSRYLKKYEKFINKGIKGFTWLIYRMLNPNFQYLFMHPRNILRVEEAIISVLSGDVFDKTPWRQRLLVFKVIFFISNKMNVSKRVSKPV